MSTGSTISDAIRAAKAKGNPAIIAYITAGFPQREGFAELLHQVADAADVVELGVPFSDPMADGTTIQRSSRVALDQGVSLRWILTFLTQMNPRPRAPYLLMSYLNPLLAYGIDKLPQAAAEAGISGFIVPDLPYEECAELRSALEAHGIALVQFVTPVTPIERVRLLAGNTSGFLYGVTMTGTTGKNVAVPQDVLDYFSNVQKISAAPVCAGFGIRSREQVAKMAPHVDGVIVGSALVEVIERGEDPGAFLRSLRA
ncbi:tryptophan synthase subunit alpha [Povalibacter sp.]|uniref:tryptophan synthase subunit alpha n=1 Tax=Povalibacter sp. TaxID=1962978 RepID=UPI002F40A7AE